MEEAVFYSIYVSPLYRSLETAKYILEENPNYKGQIIVHPLIIECPNCIDDFIYDIKKTKNDFKDLNINWDIFNQYTNKKWNENFYYFEYFNRMNENQKLDKFNKLLNLYNKGDMNNYKIEMVNEFPRMIFNEQSLQPFESFKHVYSRFLEFKNFLVERHKKTLNEIDKKVLVITHGDFLGVITNKYLYGNDEENYFPKDCCYCKNCDIISIYI